jgi:3-hydroxyacyl-CoA dehydrogenase
MILYAMIEIQDTIAILDLDQLPVNSSSHALRECILQQLEAAQTNPGVRGLVLTGGANVSLADSEVTESGLPHEHREPTLHVVMERIEASNKPVVAAVSGATLGAGLELVLACHGRVALETARVGLPEITLGLIPSAGSTQRLPRLIGIEAARDLILNGQSRSAKELTGSGLFDEIVADDVVEAALRRANALADRGAPFPRARDRVLDTGAVETAVGARRAKLNARQQMQPAYGALLEALSASALPFDQGMRRERELFRALASTTAAQALRYQFKAERAATQLAVELQATPRPVRSVSVIGAGTMGTGIAIAALDASLSILLVERDEAALERGRQRITDYYRDRVAAGKLKAEIAAWNQTRLATTTDWTRLAEADLVIEAVFEDMAVKQGVFRSIDTHARPGAVLASNTSYLDLDAIAAATSRPSDVLGLHFFSPAHVMKLLEVVRGTKTSTDVLATGMTFGSTLKKLPVLSGNAFGFIGNRIYNAYRRQCEFMLEDGAWPEDVDNALTAMGFAMGPFAVADLSGLDIAWRMRKSQAATRDPRERYVDILDQLCEQGRLGRKTGAGYYSYAEGKQSKAVDAAVRRIIEQASARRGIVRRHLAPDEIRRRALLAMVNEAALVLGERVASRPSDVDVVLVQGYGFPRWEGGPVFWARRQDRARIEAELRNLAREAGHGFVLANLDSLFAD